MKTIRYHVQLANHRTTISLEKTISDLMSIKLGFRPGTKESHQAVRKQLDSFIEHDRGRGGHGLGLYISEQAVLFVSDKTLSKKYWNFWNERYEQEQKNFSRIHPL